MEKISVNDKVVAFAHDGKVVVDNSVFEALTLKDKAGFIAATTGLGSVEFRENFSRFTDYANLLTRLKSGEDVTFELLFNGVEFTAEQLAAVKAYHAAIAPIIAAVETLIPPYPFATKPSRPTKLTVQGDTVRNGSGYNMSLSVARAVFNRAAKFWAGGTLPDRTREETGEYGRRDIVISQKNVQVGCQTINRWSVEQLAREQGWDFPDGKAVKVEAKKKTK